ncbi:hypothetical protein EVAR_69877_1 [Eumeta japonica]|uniref:Nucleic-acid-binding protein from transposon X-element n=1 Tax=Eumeta variegata TaxID=151549 RepID=A0A4C2A8N8_EUMVA|nr:hypothetical protein EVAR_69877_1 [Eumeta japonica]
MFRDELEPNDTKLKMRFILFMMSNTCYRKITVEEPHKCTGPVQCHNCQEYGHTISYCKLPTVCAVCGELHGTPGDLELSIENFTKKMNPPVEHASTTYQQPSFNRIFSADIQRLVSEKRRARRWQQHRSPSIKPDLENVQHD